jgi:manganese transport protein
MPLGAGALVTALDVFLILLLQQYGISKLEALVGVLVLTIGCCLVIQVWLVQPDWSHVVQGFRPHLSEASIYIAVAILGATVMPHNLYLQSAMVKTRPVGSTVQAQRKALRNSFLNTLLALNVAFLINAAILIVAAGTFHFNGFVIQDLREAHDLLAPVLGATIAPTLFAIALLCAGQSATVTGTMAGQIVMEGFLQIQWSPFARAVLTRGLAVVPAVLILSLAGEESMLMLLVATQVALSLQLPFAIVPLLRFTADRRLMGGFYTRAPMRVVGWLGAVLVIGANGWLVYTMTLKLDGIALVVAVLCEALCILLLAYVAFVPLGRQSPSDQSIGAELPI